MNNSIEEGEQFHRGLSEVATYAFESGVRTLTLHLLEEIKEMDMSPTNKRRLEKLITSKKEELCSSKEQMMDRTEKEERP